MTTELLEDAPEQAPPRDDGLNLWGRYRHPDGSVVTLPASEFERAAYAAKGFTFLGYLGD